MRKNFRQKYIQMGLMGCLWLSNSIFGTEISNECILKAERLYEESLFMDAYPLYEQALSLPEVRHPSFIPNLTMRLSDCYMQLNQYDKIIQLLSSLPELTSHHQEINRLLAIAYRQTSQYDKALQQLDSYQPKINFNAEYTLER